MPLRHDWRCNGLLSLPLDVDFCCENLSICIRCSEEKERAVNETTLHRQAFLFTWV